MLSSTRLLPMRNTISLGINVDGGPDIMEEEVVYFTSIARRCIAWRGSR